MTKKTITSTQAQETLDNAELLFNAEEVESAITAMAKSITAVLSNSNPLVLPIMNGGLVLGGKLIPQLNFPLQIDYIHATRYRGETSGNELHWLKKPEQSLQARTVILIDDILDEGITLAAIIDYCYEVGAKNVLSAVLAEKSLEQDKPIQHADFTGLNVPNRYVFGSGMDYHEYHRNLTGIYAV
jgi:hypoxanthine phosphoribosyltransferase